MSEYLDACGDRYWRCTYVSNNVTCVESAFFLYYIRTCLMASANTNNGFLHACVSVERNVVGALVN